MTPEQRAEVAAVWARTGAYYGKPIDDGVLRMFIADVDDLPAHRVLTALAVLRRDPRRRACPLPAEVRHHLEQSSGQSPEEVAARILGAMSLFGYTQPARARERIGELAWAVTDDMGGWVHLCQTLTTAQVQTFRAQAREIARAKMLRVAASGGALTAATLAPAPPDFSLAGGVANSVTTAVGVRRSPRP